MRKIAESSTSITVEGEIDVVYAPCGPIRGTVYEDGVLVARGIPYAKARRWEQCTPFKNWPLSEVRDCTGPSKIMPQNPSSHEEILGPIERWRSQDEGCLELTVAQPPDIGVVPVMVFIHGGDYMNGGGDLDIFQPTALARHSDVVVVSITYRLGIFGFLDVNSLAHPNAGLLDQIEALRWVQRNIYAFNGDPDRVTLFGQGTGAYSIMCLMASDIANGLFHRVIIQSAPFGLRRWNTHEMRVAIAERAKKFLSDCLSVHGHDKPSSNELLTLQKELRREIEQKYDTFTPFIPVFGRDPLPNRSSDFKARIVAAADDIPILIGYTADEGTAFAEIRETHSEAEFASSMFKNGAEQLHQAVNEAGASCALYHFNWYPKESLKYKAVHGIEMPFLMGDWKDWKNAPMLQGQESEDIVDELGEQVKNLWVAFANGADLGSRTFEIDETFEYPRPRILELERRPNSWTQY